MAAEVLEDFLPCGSILATSGYRYFSLQCIYCDLQYGNWSLFIRHLRDTHNQPTEEEEKFANCAYEEQINYNEDNIIEEELFEDANGDKLESAAQIMESEQNEEAGIDLPIELYNESLDLEVPVMGYLNNEDMIDHHQSIWDGDKTANDNLDEFKVIDNAATADDNDEQNMSKGENKMKIHDVQNHVLMKHLQCAATKEAEFRPSSKKKYNHKEDCSTDQDEYNFFNDMEHSDNDISDFERESANQIEDSNSKKISFNFKIFNKPTCDFIDCYKAHPCLWNPKHADYKNIKTRRKALHNIRKYFLDKYKVRLMSQRVSITIMRLRGFYKKFSFNQDKEFDKRQSYFERCSFLADIELDDRIQIKNISAKKIIFGQIDNFTLGFIDICKNYSLLWDNNNRDYAEASARKNAYNEISKQLKDNYDVHFCNEEVYDAIKRLQQYYHDLLEKEKNNQPLTKFDLIYLDRCKFLPPRQSKIQCHMCERMFRYDFTLQAHLLQAHDIGELPYECGYCDQRFATIRSVKTHEVRSHTKKFNFVCQYCLKGFAVQREKIDHELIHTGGGERINVCPQCGKSFRLKHQMLLHIRIVHERTRSFKCTICPKDYKIKRHLDDHMRVHLNVRDKICKTCGKTFTNYQSLYRHKQLHSEIKRYDCKLCTERFHQLIALNRHIKKHHS